MKSMTLAGYCSRSDNAVAGCGLSKNTDATRTKMAKGRRARCEQGVTNTGSSKSTITREYVVFMGKFVYVEHPKYMIY